MAQSFFLLSTFFKYDSFGQLVRENNQALDKTLIYCYDNNGNVTNVKSYGYTTADTPTGTSSQNIYTYDSIHKDRLTGVKLGSFTTPLSYNSIGYPITYGNKRFEWDNGRLVSYYDEGHGEGSSSTESFEFTYNAYGQRTVKEYSYYPGEDYYDDYVTGSTTTYTYDHSGRLIREYCTERYYASSNITREFIYLYDESGIIGVSYSLNGAAATSFYYRRNIQGDVIAIYNASGNRVAEYAYDAFGNCKIVNSSNNDLANNNPIRYRGYYYDTESGLYYLNARYYNPLWRRFISPDSTEYLDPQTINGLNQYAYCNNDPINWGQISVCGVSNAIHSTSLVKTLKASFGSIRDSASLLGHGWIGSIISGLSSAHGVVDKASSYLAGSADGLLNYVGASRFNGFQPNIDKYSKGLMLIGVGLDIASSAYNNFNNSNLTAGQRWASFAADIGYIGITSSLSYVAGSLVTKGSVAIGTAVAGYALGSTVGSVTIGFAGAITIGAGVVVIGVVAGTILISVVSDALDNFWEKQKGEWFS